MVSCRGQVEAEPLTSIDEVEVGDTLLIIRKGIFYGCKATVVRKSRSQLQLDAGGNIMKAKKEDVALVPEETKSVTTIAAAAAKAQAKDQRGTTRRGAKVSKRTMAYTSSEGGGGMGKDGKNGGPPRREAPKAAPTTVRVPGNTVDLRGMTLDESIPMVQRFFSSAASAGFPVVYLLHGHGTGALKKGLRQWLTQQRPGNVISAKPAAEGDGGDAFTMVALK